MLTSKSPFGNIRSGSLMSQNKPPMFIDFNTVSGIPPIPEMPAVMMKSGGTLVVEKPAKKKVHPFKRM